MTPLPPKLPSTAHIAALLAMLTQVMIVARTRDCDFGTVLRRSWKAAGAIRHPVLQFRVFRIFLGSEAKRVAVAEPIVMLKHLGDYLGHEFSRADRAHALIGHYSILTSKVRSGFFDRIVDGEIELWRLRSEGNDFSIALTFPRKTHQEGDLSLLFCRDEACLYTLSFSFGPGHIAGSGCPYAMYVARIQGKGGAFEAIRCATRVCEDISPASLLLAAAEGIALALRVEKLIGISATVQLSAALDSRPDGLVSTYDRFWLAFGGVPLGGSMYRLDVPMTDKPISEIRRHHRSRVLRKRAFRASVRDQVMSSFRSSVLERRASVRKT